MRSTVLVAAAVLASGAGTVSAHEQWVRIDGSRARVQAVVGAAATAAGDYGAFQWLKLDDGQVAAVRSASMVVDEVGAPFELDLGGLRFDPLTNPARLPSGWGGAGNARSDDLDLRLVQFAGPLRQSSLDALKQTGVEPLQYIHPFTYVVWSRRSALATAAQRSDVRWTADFAPAYRVLPQWRAMGDRIVDARATVYRGAAGVEAALRAAGADVIGTGVVDRHFASVRFHAPGDLFATLAAVPGVYSIQPVPTDGGLRGEMSDQVNAGNIGSDNLAFPGYLDYLQAIGVDGSGVIVADVDGGIYDTHPDLINRMLPCVGDSCGGSATDAHGTHTAGIIAADGSSGVLTANGFLRGLGMAPGANLVEQLYYPTYTQSGGMLKLMTESRRNGAVMSGNSWGPAGSPRGYDDDTRQVDVGVRDADPDATGDQPFHYVLSFMNGYGGTSSQGTPDEAKNIFTIGSTKMQSSSTVQYTAIDDLSANSAHGPALDGRSIPAMVATGCSVDSSASATGYQLMCGTSMASPHVTGASALFVEYYRNLFGHDPSPALIKAAFTAVAKNLTGHEDADGNTLTHLFDSKQGWGRMQIDPVLAPATAVQYVDQTTVFDNTGEQWTRTYTADDPDQPIRIMLAWTDAPGHGLGGSTPAWNNDLDLRVSAGAETWYGNVLDSAGWSQTGGSADAKNNTEAVFLQPTQHGGSVTIQVLAADINSDALPSSGDDTDQDFALVCYNCRSVDTGGYDLAVAAAATPDPVAPGQSLVYSIQVANDGDAPADVVSARLQVPAGVSLDNGTGAGWTCTFRRLTADCSYATSLEAGTAATALEITTQVAPTAADSLIAQVSVSAQGSEANTTNNSVSVITEVLDRIFVDGFEDSTSP